MSDTNPLLQPFSGRFGLPPFASTKSEHYGPALDVARAENMTEIEAIAQNPDQATFANTIDALELAGAAIDRIGSAFWNLTGAHTNDVLQATERDQSPKVAAHYSKITSNAALYRRVAALFDARETLSLTPEQKRVLERTHLWFVRAGAKLDEAGKARMSEIVQRLAVLGTQFSQNVLEDEKSYELPLPTEADRAGLPQFLVDAAASAAKERKSSASHVITLSRSLIEPFLTSSTRRDLREIAFKAWTKRGEMGGATDNRKIVAEILALRAERAKLLGYASFAAFKLDDTMAKTPGAVRKLLETVWTPAKLQAERERERLQVLAKSEGQNISIEAWDWRYYAEKVRSRDYGLDETEIKQYLPLDRIIAASFATAEKLFGLSFKEVKGLDLYHPDVRAFEVTDETGRHVGLFLGDYFARSSKRSGAWMSAYRRQRKLGSTVTPIIVNVCNFARAPDGQQTLLSMVDARTLFHEFGHGLHGLLSDVTYPSLACTSVARDFVELPSQLYEHWLETDEILKRFARHHMTDTPMPDALIAKLADARTFNQGFATVEYLASAIVDIDFHEAVTAGTAGEPMALEAATLSRIGMPKEIVMRHRTPHFAHVFSGDGYSSGYYSYMWSEVLDADAFQAFEDTGNVFDPATAQKLKQFVYAAGGSRAEDEAYHLFRGRAPDISGLLKRRGLAA
ncbi:MAG: M3 family metallopeptidase [Hyphomicrobiaceae bacterium]